MAKEFTHNIEELEAKLAALEKEKASLLKIVSHDLRSPLNKLFALITLFKMSANSLSDEQANYLDKMELVISDGLNKMRNLLDLRAIEGDGFDAYLESFKLGKIISKVVNDFGQAAERKSIVVVYEERPVDIESDKLAIQRILDQLISNAIKYSPLNSKIMIRIEERDENVEISIIDGGYGIADEEQEGLFKKFSILSTRTTGGESTLGLGLFIAQKMAINIGANIKYENKEGSMFILSLPKTYLA